MGRIAALAALGVVALAACGKDPVISPEQATADNAKYGTATTTTPPDDGLTAKDHNFLKALEVGKLQYSNGKDEVLQGQAVCVFLSPANGGSYVDAVQGVSEHNPTFTDFQNGFFVGAAIQTLCPDESSALPGH